MNLDDVNIGVCEVSFNGTSLGHTKDGVSVTYKAETKDLVVDKYGSTPVNKVVTGESLAIKVPLAEDTLDNLAIAIPNATVDGDNLLIGKSAGTLLGDSAKKLVLHPIRNGADTSKDLNVLKAVATEVGELAYKVDEQRVIEITFEALIDDTQDDGSLLAYFGSPIVS